MIVSIKVMVESTYPEEKAGRTPNNIHNTNNYERRSYKNRYHCSLLRGPRFRLAGDCLTATDAVKPIVE